MSHLSARTEPKRRRDIAAGILAHAPTRRLRVLVEPSGIYSPAMVRAARALERFAPANLVEITTDRRLADVIVMYVIGEDAMRAGKVITSGGQRYAAVQCGLLGGGALDDWRQFWEHALGVWSYYDLNKSVDVKFPFLHAPFGLDPAFVNAWHDNHPPKKRDAILTSGTTHGPGAEAIEEAWTAAESAGLKIYHIGAKNVVGIVDKGRFHDLKTFDGIDDSQVVDLMTQCKYVVALRYVEGLELPAAEGIACGALPVLFDQPALRTWYGDIPVWIDERLPLLPQLAGVFADPEPAPIDEEERDAIVQVFDWRRICEAFWTMILSQEVKS